MPHTVAKHMSTDVRNSAAAFLIDFKLARSRCRLCARFPVSRSRSAMASSIFCWFLHAMYTFALRSNSVYALFHGLRKASCIERAYLRSVLPDTVVASRDKYDLAAEVRDLVQRERGCRGESVRIELRDEAVHAAESHSVSSRARRAGSVAGC